MPPGQPGALGWESFRREHPCFEQTCHPAKPEPGGPGDARRCEPGLWRALSPGWAGPHFQPARPGPLSTSSSARAGRPRPHLGGSGGWCLTTGTAEAASGARVTGPTAASSATARSIAFLIKASGWCCSHHGAPRSRRAVRALSFYLENVREP